MKPSIGRIVVYQRNDGAKYPAIVQGVYGGAKADVVDLVVFCGGPDVVSWVTEVEPTPIPPAPFPARSWHWPPRELEAETRLVGTLGGLWSEDGFASWVEAAEARGGGFLATFAAACRRADRENYAVLRPALAFFVAKYPEYSSEVKR